MLAVDDGVRAGLLVGWRDFVDRVAPLVLHQRFDAGPDTVLTHIRDEWLRYDVVVSPEEAVSTRSAAQVRVLLDRDGLHPRLRPHGDPQSPFAARIETLVREFLRVMGLPPVVLAR